jgi:hypothetical protein
MRAKVIWMVVCVVVAVSVLWGSFYVGHQMGPGHWGMLPLIYTGLFGVFIPIVVACVLAVLAVASACRGK